MHGLVKKKFKVPEIILKICELFLQITNTTRQIKHNM